MKLDEIQVYLYKLSSKFSSLNFIAFLIKRKLRNLFQKKLDYFSSTSSHSGYFTNFMPD